MNATNRAVNRTILAVVGLLLAVSGGAAIAASVWAPASRAWVTYGQSAQAWVESTRAATAIPGTVVTWIDVAVIGILVVVIAVLLVAMIRTGRGLRRAALGTTGALDELGRITVNEAFASDALESALGELPEIVTARVTSNQVGRDSVLHVKLTPRQSTSPVEVAEAADRLVTNLSVLTGSQLPTYISIHAGLRARWAAPDRRVR